MVPALDQHSGGFVADPAPRPGLVPGYNVPAAIGMSIDEVFTPALIVDLDAFERNVRTMAAFVREAGVRLRAHAKTHKSADIARYQIAQGGACGICCQKTSEAEALVEAGITDILVSNEVTDPKTIDRLARLCARARIIVCVDDAANVDALSAAAARHGVTLECLVEIDVGAGRCGVRPGDDAVRLAERIAAAAHLTFSGLQAYHGSAQHLRAFAERRGAIEAAVAMTRDTVARLDAKGLSCAIVGGAGTGTFQFEGTSGVYTELQCGSYVFMDADYGRIRDESGAPIGTFENSLFILTSVMSHAKPDMAVCDAGLKVQSVDSGLPVVFGRSDVTYLKCSDEHGVITDPTGALRINDRLTLVPGHCDPTCNVHDWFVGVRGDRVECLWPVTARGRAF
jgi:3-hydroxy-D-aspartate aldolase